MRSSTTSPLRKFWRNGQKTLSSWRTTSRTRTSCSIFLTISILLIKIRSCQLPTTSNRFTPSSSAITISEKPRSCSIELATEWSKRMLQFWATCLEASPSLWFLWHTWSVLRKTSLRANFFGIPSRLVVRLCVSLLWCVMHYSAWESVLRSIVRMKSITCISSSWMRDKESASMASGEWLLWCSSSGQCWFLSTFLRFC